MNISLVNRGGRPPGQKRFRTNLSLPREVKLAAAQQAMAMDMSFSRFVERLIRDALGLRPPRKPISPRSR
jgi:hypothetical protein